MIKIDKNIVSIKTVDTSLPSEVTPKSAPRRPVILPCEIHRATIKGEEWTIFVGLLKGIPFEVFGGLSETILLPKKHLHGRICKRYYKSGGKYDLVIGEGDEEMKIKNIVQVFDDPNYSSLSRLISLSMRHGTPIQYIVEQLQRDREADLFSFSKVMGRVLKKYIEDGTKYNKGCPQCGSGQVAYQEGCLTCMSCGFSKCS